MATKYCSIASLVINRMLSAKCKKHRFVTTLSRICSRNLQLSGQDFSTRQKYFKLIIYRPLWYRFENKFKKLEKNIGLNKQACSYLR